MDLLPNYSHTETIYKANSRQVWHYFVMTSVLAGGILCVCVCVASVCLLAVLLPLGAREKRFSQTRFDFFYLGWGRRVEWGACMRCYGMSFTQCSLFFGIPCPLSLSCPLFLVWPSVNKSRCSHSLSTTQQSPPPASPFFFQRSLGQQMSSEHATALSKLTHSFLSCCGNMCARVKVRIKRTPSHFFSFRLVEEGWKMVRIRVDGLGYVYFSPSSLPPPLSHCSVVTFLRSVK